MEAKINAIKKNQSITKNNIQDLSLEITGTKKIMRIEKLSSPILGWNSYDSYGIRINEEQAVANIEAMEKRLAPSGYEYFCIDSGWFADYDENNNLCCIHINEFGNYIPSPKLFPRGLRYLSDLCHSKGLKFGIHLMRGLPRVAVEQNTKIAGTDLHARDIVNLEDCSSWCDFTYGIDMTKPGAQEYYNSVLNYLSDELQIDFLKADDLHDHPDELAAISRAIAQASRPIFFSLSPGDLAWHKNWNFFRQHCNAIRISKDIWDDTSDIAVTFDRWESWEDCESQSCLLDLDMLPFGRLQVNIPEIGNSENEFLSGRGGARNSKLSLSEKQVMITQRALAASPLLFGGDLITSPQEDIDLATHPEILACVKNMKCAKKIFSWEEYDVRKVEEVNRPGHGWIGIFNRRRATGNTYGFTAADLGFDVWPENLFSIWEAKEVTPRDGILTLQFAPAFSVVFLRY